MPDSTNFTDQEKLIHYINIRLAALGYPIYQNQRDSDFIELAKPHLKNHQEKNRLLLSYFCPADYRIQSFLNDYLKGISIDGSIKLPINTFILDRPGLARVLSLPPNQDHFISNIVKSYRIKQGILNNPKNDRRTTKNSFHIAEGGLPIPADKLSVPKFVFGNLLAKALKPTKDLLQLPFTAAQKDQAHLFVSLLLRPTVCPPAGNFISKKSMEIRFFAPASLVSNLDFVESIFGNAGDPYLPENDAGLDIDHWTGQTGCVILAPHLINATKKELGLPSYRTATEKQRREGMCWKKENETYNDGNAFKITCRDERGVMVTLIADNYYGYSKKEVKTQISFSANLYGLSEEEHAGGAIAFPSYVLGQDFTAETASFTQNGKTFKEVIRLLKNQITLKPEGYAVDKHDPRVIYIPHNAEFHVRQHSVSWKQGKKVQTIPLSAESTYVLPSGYKIHIEKQLGGPAWRLIGTRGEGTLCHKPCTVSGGGKSEISKSISYSMIQGPVFVTDFQKNLAEVQKIIKRDYSNCTKDKTNKKRSSRPLLSPERSLGSVIKLFTPSEEYTDKHNAFIKSLPNVIRQLIFVVKRYYRPEWGNNWQDHFSVDKINGQTGHELKYNDIKLVSNYLRVGLEENGAWRIFKLRPDYHWAEKVQVEDDITASIVVPKKTLKDIPERIPNPSVKLVMNCESKLFQRPDDCIYRGYDKQAELDLSTPNSFLSNFEPMTQEEAQGLVHEFSDFDSYSDPMKKVILDSANGNGPSYFVSSAHSRIWGGKRSKNPRYLQNRPDLVNTHQTYVSKVGTRLFRGVSSNQKLHYPVNAVLAGRRNNPPDVKNHIPALCVYNPIHYQELPELFMDFISSVTGKSPSTTGFGSEGALTKAPFNALWPVVDLNNALVSYILTGYYGFTSAAGFVGPKIKVQHDISLLIPEIWCRMHPKERNPEFLIKNRYLEKCEDYTYKGKKIIASRLGYRITKRFVEIFLGRLFEAPNSVFSEDMLKPETQDPAIYAKGVQNIVAAQKQVAQNYFADGSVDAACPPLKALIHIMAKGHFEGKTLQDPTIRNLFNRDTLIKSDWYKKRLETKQKRDIRLWQRHIDYLEMFRRDPRHGETNVQLRIHDRLAQAKQQLEKIESPSYPKKLVGTLGADPFTKQLAKPKVTLRPMASSLK